MHCWLLLKVQTLSEEHLLHSAGIQASSWAVWVLLHGEQRRESKQETKCGETKCPTISLFWQIIKLGAGSCFCSGVTLAPSDELWPALEVQMGLLVPWAHHEIVQRAVEEVRTICIWA